MMKSPNENNLPFCDKLSVEKLRKRLTSSAIRIGERNAFLILSGSFNPVHTQHVRILEVTRTHLENHGWTVVAGFLAPSSQEYLIEKQGQNALSLKRRINLCKLAIQESDWIDVCSKGELSSNWVRRSVKIELERHCEDFLKGHRLTGVEIMGSETVIRIFTKILAQKIDKLGESTQRGRVIGYFLRHGLDRSAQQLLENLISDAGELGVEFIQIESTDKYPQIESVSSTAIRELISIGDWEALRSKAWLSPAVLESLKRLSLKLS